MKPKQVDLEYPQHETDWPAILVQFRPRGPITWTGIHPDEYETLIDDVYSYEAVRRGYFEGTFNLTALATSSTERDALWDEMIQLLLMGRQNENTVGFFTKLEHHDLIAMTVQEGIIENVGDAIGVGTPWNGDLLSYEATIGFNVIGQFTADVYNKQLVAVSDIRVYPYTEQDPVPHEDDGEGDWLDPGS